MKIRVLELLCDGVYRPEPDWQTLTVDEFKDWAEGRTFSAMSTLGEIAHDPTNSCVQTFCVANYLGSPWMIELEAEQCKFDKERQEFLELLEPLLQKAKA